MTENWTLYIRVATAATLVSTAIGRTDLCCCHSVVVPSRPVSRHAPFRSTIGAFGVQSEPVACSGEHLSRGDRSRDALQLQFALQMTADDIARRRWLCSPAFTPMITFLLRAFVLLLYPHDFFSAATSAPHAGELWLVAAIVEKRLSARALS